MHCIMMNYKIRKFGHKQLLKLMPKVIRVQLLEPIVPLVLLIVTTKIIIWVALMVLPIVLLVLPIVTIKIIIRVALMVPIVLLVLIATIKIIIRVALLVPIVSNEGNKVSFFSFFLTIR